MFQGEFDAEAGVVAKAEVNELAGDVDGVVRAERSGVHAEVCAQVRDAAGEVVRFVDGPAATGIVEHLGRQGHGDAPGRFGQCRMEGRRDSWRRGTTSVRMTDSTMAPDTSAG